MKPGEKLILPLWFRSTLVVVLLSTVVLAYINRISSTDTSISQTMDHGAVLKETQLHFVDFDHGEISIINAATNQEITRLHTGEDGFMRSVMRGMVRERKARGLGPEVPFQLTLWESGLVSLIDPATQRRVELSAFGHDNVNAFTRLLSGTSLSAQPTS